MLCVAKALHARLIPRPQRVPAELSREHEGLHVRQAPAFIFEGWLAGVLPYLDTVLQWNGNADLRQKHSDRNRS